MKVIIPSEITSDISKIEWLYKVARKLQKIHNLMGYKYRNQQITYEEWMGFIQNWFEPRHLLVYSTIGKLRRKIFELENITIDVDKIFEEEK